MWPLVAAENMAALDNLAEEIAQAQLQLDKVTGQLDQLELLKAKEGQLKNDKKKYEARVAELRQSAEDVVKEGEFLGKPVEVAVPLETKIAEITKVIAKTPKEVRMAKMKAINKKLQQIEKLKLKDGLDTEAAKKVASEPSLRKKLAALERGEDIADSDDEVEVKEQAKPQQAQQAAAGFQGIEGVALPEDAEERKKKIRALQKKLRDIEALKLKGGILDKQAKEKRDGEQRIIQELAALEEGKSVFVLDEAAEQAAQKMELEKQIKKLQKKLEQIATLKGKTDLDADMQAKLDSEKDTNKEVHDLQMDVAAMNKKERERVAERLGWDAEPEQKNGKKKGGKK